MINDKIGKLISELNKVQTDILLPLTKDKCKEANQARQMIAHVCIELAGIIDDIEAEKAIDGCRVRLLAIEEETGDCGTDENGRCLGYRDEDGLLFEECRTCEYSVNYEEE